MSKMPDKRITVLQLCATLGLGGSERLALESADAWQQAGGRSIIAGAVGQLVDEIRRRKIAFCRLPTKGYRPWDLLANIFRLTRLIRAEHIDIIHFHNRGPGWSALAAAKLTGVPLVSTYHSAYGMSSGFKRLFNSVMARADKVVVTSHYIGRYIEEHHGRDDGRRVLIRSGIDLERFNPENISAERLAAQRKRFGFENEKRSIFIVPARLSRFKGHAVIVDAVAQLAEKRVNGFLCAFVGGDEKSGNLRHELELRISALGAGDRIRFLGPSTDMPAAYALADYAILASTASESLGLVRAEASAMGLPLITTTVGAADEVVLAPPSAAAEERTGWLIPPNDAQALAKAMEAALALAPEERKSLALRARSKMIQDFDARQGLQRLVELYTELGSRR